MKDFNLIDLVILLSFVVYAAVMQSKITRLEAQISKCPSGYLEGR